jgi:nucleoside 2-deoxyribosyltransferase
MAPLRVYMAGPLFTQVERRWNRHLAELLRERIPDAQVILPQDFKIAGKFNNRRFYGTLFRLCLEGIDAADMVVALLDGADSDSGTAFELGYARARGKPIIGIRTDFRQSQDRGVNVMLSQACTRYVFDMSFSEDTRALADRISRVVIAIAREISSRARPQAPRA